MDKFRTILFFVFLGLFAATYLAGSTSTVSEEVANAFMAEFEELISNIDAVGIFTHNLIIALPMFIPGLGVVWGLFAAWSTGFGFASIVTLTPEIEQIHPLAILFLSPFGLMELAAYSLGTSRSFILIIAIIKKTDLISLIRPTIIEIGIVTGLLLAGGYLEFYLLESVLEERLANIPES